MSTGWDFESVKKTLLGATPKPKYIITDSRDEFIAVLERINKTAFKASGDNLRYLEQLDKIKEIKAGANIEDVFPWVKHCDRL